MTSEQEKRRRANVFGSAPRWLMLLWIAGGCLGAGAIVCGLALSFFSWRADERRIARTVEVIPPGEVHLDAPEGYTIWYRPGPLVDGWPPGITLDPHIDDARWHARSRTALITQDRGRLVQVGFLRAAPGAYLVALDLDDAGDRSSDQALVRFTPAVDYDMGSVLGAIGAVALGVLAVATLVIAAASSVVVAIMRA